MRWLVVVVLVVGCGAPSPTAEPRRPEPQAPAAGSERPALAAYEAPDRSEPDGPELAPECDDLFAGDDVSNSLTGLAISVVIDRSGSSAGTTLEVMKEAFGALIHVLPADTLIHVVAFDSEAVEVIPLQKVNSPTRIANDVNRLQAGGGTNACPAVRLAWQVLRAADVSRKHVIVFADDEQPEYPAVVPAARSSIVVSVFVVGDDSPSRLASLATPGHYHTGNPLRWDLLQSELGLR